MSIRLYVGNLPRETSREELDSLLTSEVGEIGSAKLITDRKTGKCRGFGFVTVETEDQADTVIEKLNGFVFKENTLKLEKANDKPKVEEDAPQAGEAPTHPRPSGNRRPSNNNKGKNRRPQANNHGQDVEFTSSSTGDFAPDPRWAGELAKLKEMLLAQASSK